MNIFLKAYKVKPVISLHVHWRKWLFKFLACFIQEKKKYDVSCLFEGLTNFNSCSTAGFSSFALSDQFSPLNINGRHSEQFSWSQAAF
jgi:hypothetical protein